ncbi:MAG: tetratricopeptide repeat protein [Planctomycetota bacterium]
MSRPESLAMTHPCCLGRGQQQSVVRWFSVWLAVAAFTLAGSTPAPAQQPSKPMPPRGFLKYCINLIAQRQYDQARDLLEPVLADHPNWPRAQFVMALTYHKEKRYQEARSYFEKSMALDPNDAQLYVFYGWCLYYLGELDKSRALFEKFLETRPDYDDAIFALALIDFDEDRISESERRLRKVIELARQSQRTKMEAKARARLADVLVRRDQLAEARDELIASSTLNPDNYETYFKLSRVLFRLGEDDAARKAFEKHKEVKQRIRPTLPQGDRRPGE